MKGLLLLPSPLTHCTPNMRVFSPVTFPSLALLAKAAHMQLFQNQRWPLCCKLNHKIIERRINLSCFSVHCYVSPFHQITNREGQGSVQCRWTHTSTSATKKEQVPRREFNSRLSRSVLNLIYATTKYVCTYPCRIFLGKRPLFFTVRVFLTSYLIARLVTPRRNLVSVLM